MYKKSLFVLSFFAILLLINCGGSQTVNKLDESEMPDWVENPPSDPNYIFEVGKSISKDIQQSITNSKQVASITIARKLETKYQGMYKRFSEEVGLADESKYIQQITDVFKAVTSTTLIGCAEVKKKVLKEGNGYRTYVLMQYPIGAASQAFMKQISKQDELYTRFRASQTLKELDDEIKKYEEWKKNQ